MPIPDEWSVPQVFRDRLGERAGRQRVMNAEGHLLLILHKVPLPGQPEREGVFFWRAPDGQWEATRGVGVNGLRRHVQEFAAAIDDLETKHDHAGSAADYYDIIQAVVPIHRTGSHLYAVLQAAREASPEDRDLITVRDRAGEVDRAAELLHADTLHSLNYLVARRSEELAMSSHHLSHTGHRINMLAAIFLPITAIGSVFGMNLASGLEHRGPLVFWSVLLIGAMVGYTLHAAFAAADSPASSAKATRASQPRSRGSA